MGQKRNNTRRTASDAGLNRAIVLGAIGLVAGVLGSGLLIWQHFASAGLPGCGPGSACAEAASSAWGRVPGLGWPVSFVGLAYFLTLLLIWPMAVRDGSAAVRWVMRLGIGISAMFTVVMLVNLDRYLCPYCLLSHGGHLLAWIALELAHRRIGREIARTPAPFPLLVMFAAGIVLISGLLAAGQFARRGATEAQAEADLQASTDRVIEQAGNADDIVRGFTGRYRIGPEVAPMRLVIFTDYQCEDCKGVERQVEQILEERDDVSVSFKNFPLNTDCNPHTTRDLHPNACAAARAAEAAGILRGVDGFWEMHQWLFDNDGSFTNATFPETLRRMGYDPDEFIRVMQSDATRQRIQADIEEGIELGLHFTPMVFLNGVEVRGWHARDGLVRAVEDIAARQPEPASPTADQPAGAFEKYIEDWREGYIRPMKEVNPSRTLGPSNAPVTIDLWGDYHSEGTAKLDRLIREKLEEHDQVYYRFRFYPGNPDCNPMSSTTLYPHGCRAAAAGEAASRLFVQKDYWSLHDWLMESADDFSDEALREAAENRGLDADALLRLMEEPDVMASIREGAESTRYFGVQRLPMMFVNGRWVPRWELEGRDVLGAIIKEAATLPRRR